jgi:hypothetical protein
MRAACRRRVGAVRRRTSRTRRPRSHRAWPASHHSRDRWPRAGADLLDRRECLSGEHSETVGRTGRAPISPAGHPAFESELDVSFSEIKRSLRVCAAVEQLIHARAGARHADCGRDAPLDLAMQLPWWALAVATSRCTAGAHGKAKSRLKPNSAAISVEAPGIEPGPNVDASTESLAAMLPPRTIVRQRQLSAEGRPSWKG